MIAGLTLNGLDKSGGEGAKVIMKQNGESNMED
jgi:hypothetical protein